ncbi:hypothetical protein DB41_AE00210 [Neochlamydia sp. TUME1]|nr:hypothetical protein DB41_AE00210 [Neochlamydia sp. TUME1]
MIFLIGSIVKLFAIVQLICTIKIKALCPQLGAPKIFPGNLSFIICVNPSL